MTAASIYEVSHWNMMILEDGTPITSIKPQGIITDLTLPSLERDMDTTKRAGELGVVPRPKFFNEMELSFTIKSYFEDFLESLAKGMQTAITIRAVTCIESDAGVPSAYVVESKGFVSSLPFGDLSADGLESEITFMAFYLKATLGTSTIIYDPRNYVYSINGTNVFDAEKTMLGTVGSG
jgi:phage tail tube protein FII